MEAWFASLSTIQIIILCALAVCMVAMFVITAIFMSMTNGR